MLVPMAPASFMGLSTSLLSSLLTLKMLERVRRSHMAVYTWLCAAAVVQMTLYCPLALKFLWYHMLIRIHHKETPKHT